MLILNIVVMITAVITGFIAIAKGEIAIALVLAFFLLLQMMLGFKLLNLIRDHKE